MRIVFFGTSEFAANILAYVVENLKETVQIAAIVTRPDQKQGRDQVLRPPPVKERVRLLGLEEIPLYQPIKASTPEFEQILRELNPDLFLVVAYGEILKSSLLALPKYLPINIHTSLLPQYRGAAPIHRAIMAGEKEMGISMIEMVKEMDAGDILAMEKIALNAEMTFPEVEKALCDKACSMLEPLFRQIEHGKVSRIVQDIEKVTFAKKIDVKDLVVDFSKTAEETLNQIRALPGLSMTILVGGESKRLKIYRAKLCQEVVKNALENPPILEIKSGKQLILHLKEGAIELLQIQLEGKKKMSSGDCLRGIHAPISLPTFSLKEE